MSEVATLIEQARAAGLVLSRVGERIHIDSPLGAPLPDELRAAILANRDELLDLLAWRQMADELVLGAIRRIASCQPKGCRAGGPGWREAERSIDAAYRAYETEALLEALESYEKFATASFAAFEKECADATRDQDC